jgi:hypothetical protein
MAAGRSSSKTLFIIAAVSVAVIIGVQIIASFKASSGGAGPQPTST